LNARGTTPDGASTSDVPRARVFHLIKGLGRGGAERLLCEGHRYADAEGFHYGYGYFLASKSAMVEDLEDLGAEVHCFGSAHTGSMILACWKVARFLRRWEADLLHCHLPLAGVVGRVAGTIAGIPVVYSEHNLHESYKWPTRRLNRWTWGLQEVVFAVSDAVASSISKSGASGVPIHTIQNGICTQTFSRASVSSRSIRDELHIPEEATVVGTVAGFRRNKRLDIWLETARRIRESCPNVRYLLVGDGSLRGEIESLGTSLGLEDVLHIAGMQEDVEAYLAAMDVYLISSRFEGLPLAMLEAMSMQLPVVATAVGGIPEALTHGESGLLVPHGDAAALAAAVIELIGDQARADAMGASGRKRVVEDFSLARTVRELEAGYARVLSGHTVRAANARDVAVTRGPQLQDRRH
jgi:glycosyltransferase involved in cell wall biosynthesis